MTRIMIAMLLVLFIISVIWMINATILTNKRKRKLDSLYNQLFSADNITYSDRAILRLKIQELSELDTWSWQFCTALWMFAFLSLVIYCLSKIMG